MRIFSFTALPLFRKYLLRRAHGLAHHRNACVDPGLQKHFTNLGLGAAVVERAADVALQLRAGAESGEERDIDERAGLAR